MKPASGDTESGGDMRLWPATDSRSLDMLCVLDLPSRGEARGEVAIGMVGSGIEFIVRNGRWWATGGGARELGLGVAMEKLSERITEEAWMEPELRRYCEDPFRRV